jgi:glutamyl-Q tRNA(Asp) synthetase
MHPDAGLNSSTRYIGRFAPSPTGPLHFGSLVAALGSWLDTRSAGGQWHVRLDDLDRPRCVPGAGEDILRTLEAFGLVPDGPVVRQSGRDAVYGEALDRLIDLELAFPCACSRRDIREAGRVGPAGPIYPGTCRGGLPPGRRARSWRFAVSAEPVTFTDRLCGSRTVDLPGEIGDFVIRRADGLFAYHLAMVVDDAELGVTDVVRGGDLLDCTAPQIALQRALGLPMPRYLHLPVAVHPNGSKLSKQTQAPAIRAERAPEHLIDALRFLGMDADVAPGDAGIDELLAWAIPRWHPARLPREATLPAP